MPGIFSLMLHAHIPYCRKSGVWPAGEEWLFEAMNETYIPLLRVLRGMYYDKVRPRIMLGVVPVLMEQLSDGYMRDRFCDYMEGKIRRARHDMERFRSDPARLAVARYWLDFLDGNYHSFTSEFYRDILGTLRWLQDEGIIEVLTSAATHGFLPLLERDSSVLAQVRTGVETYRKYFGCRPRGFWLPECAYRPAGRDEKGGTMRRGIDEWLAGEGIEYFFVEGVGIENASFVENRRHEIRPSTSRGYLLKSGVSVFGRNEATGKQVWSPHMGYPGDPYYLEFHQKDLESGLNCWRVTGRQEKEVYDPYMAAKRVEVHARHFVSLLRDIFSKNESPGSRALVVAPYDCELFGHWWHEGVSWIDQVFRLLAREEDIECLSLGEYLDRGREGFSTIAMQPSTWGLNSDFSVWQNPEHGWIWPYINSSAVEMEQILDQARPWDDRGHRILRQMARELLLMQGSDWPFLLYTLQAKEYANQRFHHHHQRFRKLAWAARDLGDHGRLSEQELCGMEDVDCPWPEIDYNILEQRKDG